MQISQSVRVRGARWRVLDVRSYDDCQLVTLAGLTPPYVGTTRRILTPFDTIDLRRSSCAAAPGSAGALAPRLSRASRCESAPAALQSALHARIDLLPHQLEPAFAMVRGMGSRVLLADEVGLGKTIQAGLVCAELLARGAIDRVLVVAPAGLREQWTHELAERFSIAAANVDAAALRRLTATLPVGLNPWSTTAIAITSIDYIKRPEFYPLLLRACGISSLLTRRTASAAIPIVTLP